MGSTSVKRIKHFRKKQKKQAKAARERKRKLLRGTHPSAMEQSIISKLAKEAKEFENEVLR